MASSRLPNHHEIRETIRDLGHGVVFVTLWEDGRPVVSGAPVQGPAGHVLEWAQGKTVWITTYVDIDESLYAAEQLAEERGRDV